MKKPKPKTRIRCERPVPVHRRAVLSWIRVVRIDLEDGLRHLDHVETTLFGQKVGDK